ncbi:MAG TPA: IS4 family transposase [Planctomycetota bacterium]|nr:IS4 family transposase [Planctomycetota bacterium]
MDAVAPRAKPRFVANDLRGMKFFKPIRRLLERLRPETPDPNRKLHFDHYTCLLLLYFFTPTLQSLRDIQRASDFKTVARKLGVRRASLGSLSAASHVFDPELLKAIFLELAQQASAGNAVPRPTGVPDDLACIAADGSLLDALPKMLWAYWLGEHDKAVKVHLQFDLFRGAPVHAQLTDGNGSETAALKNSLQPKCLYIVDRGYMDYALYQAMLDAKSSFLARLRGNFSHEILETRALSAEACAAGVLSDQIVWIGGGDKRMTQKMRLIKVHVVNPPWHGRKPRAPRVNGKCKSIRTSETEFDVWLLTDRMDMPVESLALLYKYRWQIEIFFRWLKCTLGCRHLLAHSENGIQIQMYVALIASLLVVLWTGRKPTKASLFYLSMYFQGWASLDEVEAHLKKLKPAK